MMSFSCPTEKTEAKPKVKPRNARRSSETKFRAIGKMARSSLSQRRV